MDDPAGKDIRCLKGIGKTRAAAMNRLGLYTAEDVLRFYPRAYEDRRAVYPIGEAPLSAQICIRAEVISEPAVSRIRRGMELLKVRVSDGSGAAELTWFNQVYLRHALRRGETYIFFGQMSGEGHRRTMTNPVFEPEEKRGTATGRILPVYRLVRGVTQKVMASVVRQVLDDRHGAFPDYLPASVRAEHELADAAFSYENIHFPEDDGSLAQARRRLAFEELFVLSAGLADIRRLRAERTAAVFPPADAQEFWKRLPFSPTAAQRRAVEEAMADLGSGRPMSRLLQGDVGSGKTLVAAALIWHAVRSGHQAAFMAPTEILAGQHERTLSGLLAPFGMRVVLLTGSMSAAQKRAAEEGLVSGEADVAVGTHALLGRNVSFRSLGIVITDEQHRFGVQQRTALTEKGDSPHVLVMSATPIPRTLALILYGDLELSVLDELPPGRRPVATYCVGEQMRPRIWRFIRKLTAEGRQVFIVCPRVEEKEDAAVPLRSALEHAEELRRDVFPDLRIACIHGRVKPREKEEIMSGFSRGEYDILVSTTVIEVGVDIPNAALMVVENAERFGLSQLHQLRGRVGRGEHQSYCILFCDSEAESTRARMKIMTETNDGFRIAQKDLELRGPGDFFGARQHGLPEMHAADLSADMSLLKQAQAAAQAVIQKDPALSEPENRALRNRIDELFTQNGDTFH